MVADSSPLAESSSKTAKDEGALDDMSISLQVSGGLPEEAYYFFLSASGQGLVNYEFSDNLRGVEKQSGQVTLESDEIANLFNHIVASGVLEIAEFGTGFVPETTVGKLEIFDGNETYTTFFAAQTEQAEIQDRIPPPELTEATEAIYALAARVMGIQSVKP